jgi:hypothetical protein
MSETIRQNILYCDWHQPPLVLDYLGLAHGCFAAHQLMAVLFTAATTNILAELPDGCVCGLKHANVYHA